MKLVFLGPPGAGKGTQAGNIAKALGIPHISTGDMFRAAIKNETPIGLRVKRYLDRGALVPDEVTCEMVQERVSLPDCAGGYLLDGFPRDLLQAEALEEFAAPDCVVNIAVTDEALLNRLTGRRVCRKCSGTFHITNLNGAAQCPDCGGELYHRDDDKPETIQNRLNVYHAQTEPLIDFYGGKGVLETVDGAQPPDAVGKDILAALARYQ
ncbi:MAG: adenylate kinase [Christensenellales bacterium]|jgi:adenylate kinase